MERNPAENTVKVGPVRNVRPELWRFLLAEKARRNTDGGRCREGDLLNEALEQWQERIDPLARIRRECAEAQHPQSA